VNLFPNDLPTVSVDKRNTTPTVETGRDLLNRLLVTRRVRWEQKELDRLKAENKNTRSDEWKSKCRLPTVLQEPPSATIPESWVWVSAETVCESVRDGTHDTPKYVNEGIPLVTSKDLTSGRIDFAKTKNISEADHLEISKRSDVENGDVLFAMIGTIGNPLVVNADRKFSIKNVGLFKKNDLFLECRYLKYWLESPSLNKWLTPRLKGSNQKFAPLGLLRSLAVPLAPLSDQKRIVAEIETQFTRLEAGIAGLRRVQTNLKRYRAAVLKAACEGKLVPTEAELALQERRTYETGAELLERILTERRQKWKGKGKYKEPAEPNTTNLPELPVGWTVASLEQLTSANRVICYGILMPKENVNDGVLYVKVKDMKGDRIDVQALHRTSREIADQYARASLKAGDLLLAIRGTYGRVAEVPAELEGGNITQDTARLDINGKIDRRYVAWFLRSEDTQNYFNRVARGVAVKGVNIGDVKPCPVFLPPSAEQQRIVAEVERRLSVVEEIGEVVNTNLQRATRLRQSILQRAFEGKLVQTATTETSNTLQHYPMVDAPFTCRGTK